MFICGNDADAKQTATAILNELGWDATHPPVSPELVLQG